MQRGDDGDRPFEATVLDALPVGVIVVAADGVIGWVSHRAAEFLGTRARDLVGGALLDLLAPQDLATVQTVLDRVDGGPSLLMGPLVVGTDGNDRLRRGSAWAVSEHGQTGVRGVVCLIVDESSEQAAQLDPLTGAANRSVLTDGSRDDATPKAVLCVDIDDFRAINAAHGRRAGDQVLIEIVRRMAAVLRPTDTLARLGGDEFAALCSGITVDHQAERVAERILEAIAHPFDVGNDEVVLQATIGISVGGGTATATADILEAADRALRTAKGSHRGHWRIGTTDPGPT